MSEKEKIYYIYEERKKIAAVSTQFLKLPLIDITERLEETVAIVKSYNKRIREEESEVGLVCERVNEKTVRCVRCKKGFCAEGKESLVMVLPKVEIMLDKATVALSEKESNNFQKLEFFVESKPDGSGYRVYRHQRIES